MDGCCVWLGGSAVDQPGPCLLTCFRESLHWVAFATPTDLALRGVTCAARDWPLPQGWLFFEGVQLGALAPFAAEMWTSGSRGRFGARLLAGCAHIAQCGRSALAGMDVAGLPFLLP
mmetsp:Transcript_18512/g.40473  ORF Transcript_18512/g.40473 Transcript_18512/m.40473 type:complete len:117 (-) Transcript_18512:115-465(-)